MIIEQFKLPNEAITFLEKTEPKVKISPDAQNLCKGMMNIHFVHIYITGRNSSSWSNIFGKIKQFGSYKKDYRRSGSYIG